MNFIFSFFITILPFNEMYGKTLALYFLIPNVPSKSSIVLRGVFSKQEIISTSPTIISVESLIFSSNKQTSSLFAGDYAYEASKGTPLYKEFKKGDFNPYWFEQRSAYAYDRVSANTPLYKEFKEGDFNPYWFEK